MRRVTSAKMRKIEELTVKKYGISVLMLMESAGIACVEEILKLRISKTLPILIFCGPGNNGGDGFVIARHLLSLGFHVQVLHFPSEKPLSTESRFNFELLKKMKAPVKTNPSAPVMQKYLRLSWFVVDALFGIGLSRPLEGKIRKAIEQMNASGAKVLSVDIPSGLHADTGEVMGAAVKADLTVTFGLPKKAFGFSKAKSFTGQVIVKPICFPKPLLMRK